MNVIFHDLHYCCTASSFFPSLVILLFFSLYSDFQFFLLYFIVFFQHSQSSLHFFQFSNLSTFFHSSFSFLFCPLSSSGVRQWLSDNQRLDSIGSNFFKAWHIKECSKRLNGNTYLIESNPEEGPSDHSSII